MSDGMKVAPPPMVGEMVYGPIPGSYEERRRMVSDGAREFADKEGLLTDDAMFSVEATFDDHVIICIDKWKGDDTGSKYYSVKYSEKDGDFEFKGPATQVEVKAVVKAKREAASRALGLIFKEGEPQGDVTLSDVIAFLGTGPRAGFSFKTVIGEGSMKDDKDTKHEGFKPIVKENARGTKNVSTARRSAPSTAPKQVGGSGATGKDGRPDDMNKSSDRRSASGGGPKQIGGDGVGNAGNARGAYNKSTSRHSGSRMEDADQIAALVAARVMGRPDPDFSDAGANEEPPVEENVIDITDTLDRARSIHKDFSTALETHGEEYVTDPKVRDAIRRGYAPRAEKCMDDKKKGKRKFSIEFFKKKGKEGEKASKQS